MENQNCKNCEFWGSEISYINEKYYHHFYISEFVLNHLTIKKAINPFKINELLLDYKKCEIKKCQKISNASITESTLNYHTYTNLKPTDYDFSCGLWKKKFSTSLEVRANFFCWFVFYKKPNEFKFDFKNIPDKYINHYKKEELYENNLKEIKEFKWYNPKTWKYFKDIKTRKFIANQLCTLTYIEVNDSEYITQSEFEQILKETQNGNTA